MPCKRVVTGKWNGFGGKVEAGETVLQGALRELDEEACIKGKDAKQTGRLLFEFKDDPVIMDVRVFRVTSFEGTPTETEEMRPNSFKVSDIPYDSMVRTGCTVFHMLENASLAQSTAPWAASSTEIVQNWGLGRLSSLESTTNGM